MIDSLDKACALLERAMNKEASRSAKSSLLLVASVAAHVVLLVGMIVVVRLFYGTAQDWRLAAKESLALVEDAGSARSALFASQQTLARCMSQVEQQVANAKRMDTAVVELGALLDGTLQRLAEDQLARREARDGDR